MKISRQLTIDVSAEQIWRIVAHDFASVGQWASGVARSTINLSAEVPEGAQVGGRICDVPGFGQLHETFTTYDEAGKTFTYEAVGLPFFVRKGQNTWTVRALDARTTQVSFQVEMQLMPIIGLLMQVPMKFQLKTLLENAVEELKHYAETGQVHPRKLKLLSGERVAAH